MAQSKKALNEWLASIGVNLNPEQIVETPIEKEPSTHQMGKWEAQSLLTSLKWPYPELTPVKCWECGERFLTNYEANTYCSMLCYKTALKKRGLQWRPERTFFEQWGNLEPPLMISPESVKAMRRLLSLLDQGMIGLLPDQEPDSEEEQSKVSESVSPDPPTPYTDPDIQSEQDQDLDSFADMLDGL